MSYRRAWLLVDDMNNCFRDPVIEAQPGGAHGGGATLTAFGQKLVDRYRAIEADTRLQPASTCVTSSRHSRRPRRRDRRPRSSARDGHQQLASDGLAFALNRGVVVHLFRSNSTAGPGYFPCDHVITRRGEMSARGPRQSAAELIERDDSVPRSRPWTTGWRSPKVFTDLTRHPCRHRPAARAV
jgi:hypothetical protein